MKSCFSTASVDFGTDGRGDVAQRRRHVPRLLDHPIRPLQHRLGNRQAEGLSGLEVDDQLERGHFLHREVGRFGSRALPALRQRAPLIGYPSHLSNQAIISRPPWSRLILGEKFFTYGSQADSTLAEGLT